MILIQCNDWLTANHFVLFHVNYSLKIKNLDSWLYIYKWIPSYHIYVYFSFLYSYKKYTPLIQNVGASVKVYFASKCKTSTYFVSQIYNMFRNIIPFNCTYETGFHQRSIKMIKAVPWESNFFLQITNSINLLNLYKLVI